MSLLKKGILLICLLALQPLFGQHTKPAILHYLLEIKDKAGFDRLKGVPLSQDFKGIECVKLVYVINTKTLYYLESKRYKLHYRFAQEALYDPDDLEQFNTKNYSNRWDRKYILATFNYNVNTQEYFLQFTASDNLSDEMIKVLVNKISTTFYGKTAFKVLLNTTNLLSRKKEIEKTYAIITSDELFKNQRYQPICKGRARGILTFIDADSIKQSTNYENCILVLKGNSNQIPVCKGIITDEFQTPLSHICLLTNNRKTPSAAQKDIFSIDSLKRYNGKFVEIIVEDDNVKIKTATSTGELPLKKNKPKLRIISDTLTKEIADLNQLSYTNKNAYGSKTSNLAELKKIERRKKSIHTPPIAYGVPFYYYLQHIKQNNIIDKIQKLLQDSVALHNDSILDLRLKKIRNGIRKAPLDKDFLKAITDLCVSKFGKQKVRFRSSSNCEDESNFNGAGLYTSESGIAGDSIKSIESAIKKVWSSLWTTRAFKERAFFNVDGSLIYMGILVHMTYDDELINGVAITKNLYRDYEFGFVINMQKGEEAVVSPKAGITCEQLVSYMNAYSTQYNDTRSADWISFSSLQPSGSLLSADELLDLTHQLEVIKNHFYSLYKLWPKVLYKDFAMDVEFKMIETPDKKHEFVFKQARPYNN